VAYTEENLMSTYPDMLEQLLDMPIFTGMISCRLLWDTNKN